MYKKAFSLFLMLCIVCTFICADASAEAEDNRASYLKIASPYVISDKTPEEFFINTLLDNDISDDDDLEPDLLTSTRYISLCASKCGLTEYGTFPSAHYPADMKSFLIDDNRFETSSDLSTADIGDIVFWDKCPGVVVKEGQVLFCNEDYLLFLKEAKDINEGLVIKIVYPYYEQLAMLYMVNDLEYSRAKAVGILTNLHFESMTDPTCEEKSNGMGYGVAQWSKDRRLDLELYCYENGRNINSLYAQLDFMDYELTNRSDFSTLKYEIKHVTQDEDGAYDAAYMFCETFENPIDATNSAIDRGVAATDTFYPLYGGLALPK